MMRAVLSVLFSLTLVATSHAMGAARHGNMAVGSMVICAGEETYVVYVDEQGEPTTAPHMCPECALHVSGAVGPPPLVFVQPFTTYANTRPPRVMSRTTEACEQARARAPPLLG